jgi:hypothetical protein
MNFLMIIPNFICDYNSKAKLKYRKKIRKNQNWYLNKGVRINYFKEIYGFT